MLTVYLQKPASIFGRIVSWFTKSPIAHTFISIGDGYFLEADLFGLRIFDIKEFNKRKIVSAYIPIDYKIMKPDARMKLFSISLFLKNKPYDYILTLSFLLKRLINIPRAYNCVETVKYVLDRMGVIHNIQSKDKPCDMIKLENLKNWEKIQN